MQIARVTMYGSIFNRGGRSRALLAIVSSITLQNGGKTFNGEAGNDASNLTYSSSEQVLFSPDFPFSQAAGHPINNFMVVYDKRARNPKYVVERLYRENVMCTDDEEALAKKKKRKPFFVETGIDSESFRSSPKDYTNVPYDRGHMAPAADFICSPDLRDATFTMANICPQAPAMNKGFWAKFEAWLRYQLTNGPYEEMIVITGPVYAPVYVNGEWVFINRTIGTFPKLVHVPTHFYKLVVCYKRPPGSVANTRALSANSSTNSNNGTTTGAASKGSAEKSIVPYNSAQQSQDWWPADLGNDNNKSVVAVAAFLVPNTDHVDSKTPLAHAAVRIEQLEAILGYKLLPETVNDKVKLKLDSVVPPARELSLVLDGRTEPSDLVFTNGKTTLLLPPVSPISQPSSNSGAGSVQLIRSRYAGVSINSHGKNSLVSLSALVSVQHLCEQVDCNKPLFGK